MHIDRLGIVHEGINYIPDGTVVEHCFKVRVLIRKGDGRYEVVGEEEYSGYPSDDQIMWCIAHYEGTQAVIEKVHYLIKLPFTEDSKHDLPLVSASDIDFSNTVFMTLSNPSYQGEEINTMDVAYEYPKERIHIIEMIKLAVRCGMKISFHSDNKKAMDWLIDYYEEYKS